MIILLHSSKTMRVASRDPHTRAAEPQAVSTPELLSRTEELASYLKTLSSKELGRVMHLSPSLAEKTHALIAGWAANLTPDEALPAIDCFIGDIYSGLRAHEFTTADRTYAQKHLRILSGLYGILRPLDAVQPYRLEMGYKCAPPEFTNLYEFWGDRIAGCLASEKSLIVNLSSVEYSSAVLPFVTSGAQIIAPHFLTRDPASHKPVFKTIHAKIARGAFAHWLILNRVDDPNGFHTFSELGYQFDAEASTPNEPTFVCETFGGIGLSMRLQPVAPTSRS